MQIYANYGFDYIYFYLPNNRDAKIGFMLRRNAESVYQSKNKEDQKFFIQKFCIGKTEEMMYMKSYSQNPVEDENQLPFPMSYFYRNMIIGAFEATIDGI